MLCVGWMRWGLWKIMSKCHTPSLAPTLTYVTHHLTTSSLCGILECCFPLLRHGMMIKKPRGNAPRETHWDYWAKRGAERLRRDPPKSPWYCRCGKVLYDPIAKVTVVDIKHDESADVYYEIRCDVCWEGYRGKKRLTQLYDFEHGYRKEDNHGFFTFSTKLEENKKKKPQKVIDRPLVRLEPKQRSEYDDWIEEKEEEKPKDATSILREFLKERGTPQQGGADVGVHRANEAVE